MKLRDAHVLVTGGSKGIGAALARGLRDEGARLTLLARASDQLDATAKEVDGLALPCDLTDFDGLAGVVHRAEQESGPLSVLVNNAALQIPGALRDLQPEDVRRQLTANLLAPIELARQALPGMVDRDSGAICSVSSLAGEYALPHIPLYGSSKAGLTKLSLDLIREMDGTSIDVLLFMIGSVPGTQLVAEGSQDRVIAEMERIFQKLPAMTTEYVAQKIVSRLRKGGDHVVTLPRYAAPLSAIRMMPIHVADRLFRKKLAGLS